jgi:L-cystine transport system substrate-binding protein
MSSRRLFLTGLALAWIGSCIPGAEAAESLLDQIRHRGRLRIGVEGTYPPFNYEDENGNLVGFEIDFGKAVAKQLGVAAEFVPTKWDGMLAALDTGRLDVVINQVTITPERQKTYDFTQPYTYSGIQIIARKDDAAQVDTPAKLAGKTVGVGLGTNYEQWLRAHAPQAQVKTYDDDPSKLQDLRVGRIDAVLNDRLMAGYLIKQSGGQLVAAGVPFATQSAGIAVQKGHPELLAALNQAIDRLRQDGALSKLSVQWFGTDATKPGDAG